MTFQLTPKSTTLDNLQRPYTARYCKNDPSFGAHHGNLKEDRSILSAAVVQPRDSTFRRHKVRAHICVDSVARGPQTTVGWSEPAIFSNFGRRIFGTFRAEANVIMWRHEVPFQRP